MNKMEVKNMIYRIRKMAINNMGELHAIGKRCRKMVYPTELEIGGLYFFENDLWRIEEKE